MANRFLAFGLVSAVMIGAAASAQADCGTDLAAEKSLVVINAAVIDGPLAQAGGPFTFGALVTAIFARTADPSLATAAWFSGWTLNEIEGSPLEPRSPGLLMGLWPRTPSGTLDLERAPFNLLAVIYRPDLESVAAPNGEARLVYGAFDPYNGAPLDFTVIFEFALPSTKSRQGWAQAFADLSRLEFGPDYSAGLTDVFASVLDDAAGNLAQVRTNDFYLGGEWELREFHLSSDGWLKSAPVAMTPDHRLNSTTMNDFIGWANANADAIAANDYEIPAAFLGASALVPDDSFRWFNANPFIPEAARFRLSMNSCNGCHGGETSTRFQHILPRRNGTPTAISAFLKNSLPERTQRLKSLVCPEKNA